MKQKIPEKQFDLFGNRNQVERNVLLNERFIIPPFSVLDTKQGYWVDRKNYWLKILGNLEESREKTLFSSKFNPKLKGSFAKKMMEIGTTSHFDPVLAEIIYKWFNIPNGKILDVFGGEQTKGLVAGVLGYPYIAIEFRKEQVAINNKACEKYPTSWYIVGDSKYLNDLIPETDFDLCFTSPPYYDLEVYSKSDASALGSYEEFLSFYKIVFSQVFSKLKENRFLILKVGEIRDKKTGEYRNFIGDNIRLMKEIGFKYYNEIIYLQQIGSAPLRVKFETRKITKIHQNILVFYKGNLNKILNEFRNEIK